MGSMADGRGTRQAPETPVARRLKSFATGNGGPRVCLRRPAHFVFFFAAIEFGRGLMAIHGLETASREACRIAVAWNPTNEDIESAVAERLSSFGISDYTVTIEPDPPTGARQWEPIRVRITVPYAEVSWLPLPRFLQTVTLHGSCTLPQESDQSAS